MKRRLYAVLLFLFFSSAMTLVASPFSDSEVQINNSGFAEASSSASADVAVPDSSTSSANSSNLKKAVDRYLYLVELLKNNPEVAPAYTDHMSELERKILDKIAQQQNDVLSSNENGSENSHNNELTELNSKVTDASSELDSFIQAGNQPVNSDPINQADADYIATQQENDNVSLEKKRAINEIRYSLSRLKQKIYAGATTEELNLTLNWLQRLFAKAEADNLELPDYLRKEYDKLRVTARQLIAEQKKKNDPENLVNEIVYGLNILEKRIQDGDSAQQTNATLKWTNEKLERARAAGVEVPAHIMQRYAELKKKVPPLPEGVVISDRGKKQMAAVVNYALNNHGGYSGGDCFEFVWRYLYKSGYGNISNYNDLRNMQSDWARHFSDFLNASQANLDEAGLQRLDTAYKPPITNPHDPRIPRGAVIVVAPNSYGTRHRYAGDIVIKAGEGHFVNDGPRMNYGTRSTWYGKVLGVYVPK